MAPSKNLLPASSRPKLLKSKKVNKSKRAPSAETSSKKKDKVDDKHKENENFFSKISPAKNADMSKTNSVDASKVPGSHITKKVNRAQSMSAPSDIIDKLNPHERSQLKKRIKQGNSGQSRSNNVDKETSPLKPFRFGLAPSKPVKNGGVASRWNPAVNSSSGRKSADHHQVEVPTLNETNVKNFEKKIQLQSRRSHGGFQMAATKPHNNMSPMPFSKPNTATNNLSKKPTEATDSTVVNEKVLKPSDFKAKKTRGFSFENSPRHAPVAPPECEVHQQEKSFVVIHKPKPVAAPEPSFSKVTRDVPQWSRPGINRKNEKSSNVSNSSSSRNPPTAVVAPLNQRETTKPAVPPKLNKPEINKKKSPPPASAKKIEDSSMIPDDDYNTFIEKDLPKSFVGGGGGDEFIPVDSFDTFVEKVDVPASRFNGCGGGEPPKPQVVDGAGDKKSSVTSKKSRKKSAKSGAKLGHDFHTDTELSGWVNWCDACGAIIMTMFGAHHIACSKCQMLCHSKCIPNVSLTCEADVTADQNSSSTTKSLTAKEAQFLSLKTTLTETKDESTLKEYNTIQRKFSKVEICRKIEQFNQTVKGSQQMTLQDDGQTFRGFIRVSMNLQRPVTAHEGSKTVKHQNKKQANGGSKASFYIDKGAMKALHLTSDTTAQKVVEALLNKFKILDNPLKFALFERFQKEEGHVMLRKMLPGERPLFLRLLWGVNSEDKSFILQENESRDINWNAFSATELTNFISMMTKEENDHLRTITQKYDIIKSQVRKCIKELESC